MNLKRYVYAILADMLLCSPLADSGVEKRRLVARVGSYQQQKVTLLDAGDARVQQVVGAQVSAVEDTTK